MAPEDIATHHHGALKDMLGQQDAASLLPFADLGNADAQAILDRATVRQIAPNGTCFHEGDSASNFYVLLEGVLRVMRTTPEGEQVVFLHITPGQLFGIAKAFDNSNYSATARAASDGIALAWPSELWDVFIRDYAGFQAATRQAVGSRVEEMQKKVVEMATLQVEQRIARAILRLMQNTGKQTDAGTEIGFPITRQDISEMTGTTLHSVSRYLSQWQKSGIIASSRRRIVVHRPKDLPV